MLKISFPFHLCSPIVSVQCFELIATNFETFPHLEKFSSSFLSVLVVTESLTVEKFSSRHLHYKEKA